MRKSVLFFILMLLASGSEAWGGSFDLLAREFHRGLRPPDMAPLFLGSQWSCSSSKVAAEKNFRYVQIWRKEYLFGLNRSHAVNVFGSSEFRRFRFDLNGEFISYSSQNPRRAIALRFTDDGDMIVAHLIKVKTIDGPVFSGYELDENWDYLKFDICEKPSRHGNKSWETSDEVWIQSH